MRRLLRLLRVLVVLTALVVAIVVGGVLGFEAGGGLERRLQDELDRLVEAEPDLDLDFRSARVDWTTPAVTVEGLHLVGGQGELYLETVTLYLDLSPDAPAVLHGIEVGSGRLVVEQRFTEAVLRSIARLQQRLGEGSRPVEPTGEAVLPTIGLDGLEVALRVPSGDLVDLGQGEARFELVERVLSVRGTVAVPQDEGGARPLYVEVTQTPDGTTDLRAATRNLDVASRGSDLRRFLPPALRGLDFAARASVDVEASLVDGALARSTTHLRLERGYLRAGDDLPALEDLELTSDLSWTRPEDGPADGLDAWRGMTGSGHFTAGILGETLTGETRLGRDGRLLVEVSDRDLALGDDLLAAAGLPDGHPARESVHALGLGGRVDLDLGLGMDLGLERPGALLEAVDLVAEVRSDGGATFCFNGYEVRGRRQGFPLRADQLHAQAVLGLSGTNRRTMLLGLLDVSALHGTGPARAQGMIATPLVPRNEPDLDLWIEVEERALDETLRQGLAGLSGTDMLWDEFAPGGGMADAWLRLRSREHEGGINSQLELTARDAPMRWAGLPIDLHVDELELWLRWSRAVSRNENGVPIRGAGAVWKARGRSSSVEDLAVVGMSRDRIPRGTRADPTATSLHTVEVTGSGLALRGSDWNGLVQVAPGLDELTDELGAKGRLDFRWTDRSVARGVGRELDLEATPAVLQLLPRAFPVVLRDLAGRINLSDRGDGSTRLHAVLEAAWAAGPLLAGHARFDLDADELGGAEPGPGADAVDSPPVPPGARLVALAAPGLDPSNQALRGALGTMDRPGAGEGETPELEGRLDLVGDLTSDAAGELQPHLALTLRSNRFRSGPLELADLEGGLVLTEDVLSSPRVTGTLAGTPVELLEPRFALAPGADPDLGEAFFATRLVAEDLPLDREHLEAFLEPATLDALVQDLGWRGEVDLDGVDLSLTQPTDGGLRVAVRGRLVPSAMELVLGVPIEVARAEVLLEELVLEAGRARAWGTTRGLFGAVAGRELRDAAALFSYVDQRLTIEDLDAAFAGGRLTSPGGEQGLALALDLVPPHHFAVGVELTGVEAGELLSGAFGGGDTRGRIDAAIRLEGKPGDLLAATGAGWLRIQDARLFSIPVFRELFTQLGFDATAVFDSMRTTFALKDGVLDLRELRARSPLLRLEGAGNLDLDGSLVADLEVRYSVVEKLGPLRFFVYWFQNSILRVAVRGDVHRPVVLLKNSILDLFGEEGEPAPRLPLPPVSKPRP